MTTMYLTQAGVLARGWTQSMVNNLLGEPDDARVNPRHRSGPRIKLFNMERVVAMEQSSSFAEMAEKAARRREAGAPAIERRKEEIRQKKAEVAADLLAAEVFVERDSLKKIEREARASYRTEVSDAHLDQVVVNYIRHKMTNYDDGLRVVYIEDLDDGTAVLWRRRVLDAIAAAYPTLAAECGRQKRERCLY